MMIGKSSFRLFQPATKECAAAVRGPVFLQHGSAERGAQIVIRRRLHYVSDRSAGVIQQRISVSFARNHDLMADHSFEVTASQFASALLVEHRVRIALANAVSS